MWRRRIKNSEYYRDWNSDAARLFNLELMSLYNFVDSAAKSPFMNEAWTIMVLPFQLCSRGLYAFFDEAVIERRFKEDGWFSVADSLIWKALFETIREIGDLQFVSSNLPIDEELPDDTRFAVSAALFDLTNMNVIEESESSDHYTLTPCAFGRSRRWAALSEHDDITLVGGDDAFVTAFTERCGGIERIQERYLYLIECEMIYSDDQEFYVQLSEKIGWPVPHFEETNYV